MANRCVTCKVLTVLAILCFIPSILFSANGESYKFPTVENDSDTAQPRYVLTDIQGNPIDEKKGVRITGFQGIKITAGEGYRIVEIQVTLGRGKQRITYFIAYTETLDFEQWLKLFQPGDRIIIEVKKVVEKTAAGDKAVTVSGVNFTIPVY